MNKTFPEEEMAGSLNLKGELLKDVMDYDDVNNKIKELSEQLSKLREIIMTKMKESKVEKAKSQLYSVVLSHIKTKKLAQKKLQEILYANNLGHYYEECLYDSEYDQLRVSRRKGGSNIF